MRAYLLTRPLCSACQEAKAWLPLWLAARGIAVEVLDASTPEGLGEAAWLELADSEVLPVLSFHDVRGEVLRFKGGIPAPEVLETKLAELGVGDA